MKKRLPDTLLSILICIVMSALYLNWFFIDKGAAISTEGLIFSLSSLVLFCVLCVAFVPKLTGFFYSDVEAAPLSIDANDKRIKRKDYLTILIFIVATRIFIYAFAYFAAKASGRNGDFSYLFQPIWLSSGIDAPSYLGIAQNWYVTSGDPMYHIVFFPLYSVFIKLFSFLTGETFISALLVSNLCTVGVGIFGYELVRMDCDRKTALRFVKYALILPAAFFYCAPMTEGLFVLLCILTLLFARKRLFLLAGLFGAMAAFTRSPGVLLIIPCGVEYIRALRDTCALDDKKLFRKRFWGWGLCIAAISLGFFGYLLVNYTVWGDPFKFSQFQAEHWGQSLSYFFNTAEYQSSNMFDLIRQLINVGSLDRNGLQRLFLLFMPGVVYMFASLATVFAAVKKLRPSYTAYFIVYFVFVCGATWLLSAPRYLMASITLPLAIAVLTKNKYADIICTVVISILSLMYLACYASGAPIY